MARPAKCKASDWYNHQRPHQALKMKPPADFDAIALEKDVDGVTCLGFGRMSMGEHAYGSATPAGIVPFSRSLFW